VGNAWKSGRDAECVLSRSETNWGSGGKKIRSPLSARQQGALRVGGTQSLVGDFSISGVEG